MRVASGPTIPHLIRREAIHLSTTEPGTGLADLEPLIEPLRGATIVGLGEPTHGSREVFQLKHRLVEMLVARLGFTVVAFEAGWPEAAAVDRYVRYGEGDPAAALAGLGYWTWDTEEVAALIRWLRTWNESRPPARRVRFGGVDARFSSLAVALLQDYCSAVDPEFARDIAAGLGALRPLRNFDPPGDDEAERQHADTIARVRDRLDDHRHVFVARSSDAAWGTVADDIRVIAQIDAQRKASALGLTAGFTARDRAMADNVDCLLRDGRPGTKVAVWAHNGHVARDPRGLFVGADGPPPRPMGRWLAERHGDGYAAVGFAFGAGAFQAVLDPTVPDWAVEECAVGEPPAGSLDAVCLAAARSPAFVLPLHNRAGPLADWLGRERVTRDVGAAFWSEEDTHAPVDAAARYDALAFVARTTRARSTPTGRRPR